jgi:IS30 family transposase
MTVRRRVKLSANQRNDMWRRSPLALTLEDRKNISRGIACGWSIREIAKGLQRAVSTVSREVARHGGRPLYRATDADQQAWESALRPKRCLLALHVKLQEIVAGKLILDWSPARARFENSFSRVPRSIATHTPA